ncbi:MAG: EAL domain-containing protein, partial [Lentihominibacter sp.]|nr:EAL domain-containing protein [Lentihominibacter sp.]
MNSIVRKRIMVVEDNSLNKEMLRVILADSYDIVEAEHGQEAFDILKTGSVRIDLILLDVVMPVMDGFTFLEQLKNDEMLKLIPVIVATQSDGDDNEIKALRCGATDFFSKPYKPEIIRHRIENIFRLRENATIASQFQYDSMTDLYSRGYFFMKVAELLEANPDIDYNIVCINVVNFKLYNEVFGEKKGDEILIAMAEYIRENVGDSGLCGRFGGDRFVVLQEREREIADRKHFTETGRSIEGITVKFGVYEIFDRSIGIDIMCDRGFMAADSIRNRYDVNVALYDAEMRTRLIREKTITESMESAVTNDQFEIYYQPKYDVDSVQIAGAEALIRWNHPELGYVPPSEFITLFEKNGFITILDKYVINKVCMQMGEWKAEGLRLPPVSVNLSRTDVYCSDIVEYITGCIETNGLAASDIHIEITESAYTEHPAQIIAMVEKMRDNGIVIELDDFGTGYSSLNMLNEINADVLKMDMRFIQTKSEKEAQQGILKLIINLAR